MFRKPQSFFFQAAWSILWVATLLAGLSGCRDARIATYQAAKDPPKQQPAALSAAATDAPAPQIRWIAPAHWQAAAPANAAAANVRVGSFTITATDGSGRSADMAVTTFPGDVGGDLANINRWRGQINLGPITAAELPSAYVTISAPAGEFLLADMTGGGQRTLGAWFKQPAQNRTWFFKLTGDIALVAAEREAFVAFLKTVSFPTDS